MADRLTEARKHIRHASGLTDDAVVREQLDSLEEGLMEITSGDKTADTRERTNVGENLEEIEEKLGGLVDETSGTARENVKRARNEIDAYRRSVTREWE